MAESQRIVFMGTSSFARIVLEELLRAGLNIVGVYTQPDRPAGRGMKMRQSGVKRLATEHGLPVFQPVNFRAREDVDQLAALKPDFLVVASYGLLLPQAVLDVPRLAPINIHASLLPALRGAAPIQRAIQENWQSDARTGVSIMKMELALDAGPVYATAEIPIDHKTAAVLEADLASLGADLLLRVLPEIAENRLEPRQQDNEKATYAAKLTKTEGEIDWNSPALQLDALVRAMAPWPGARTVLQTGAKEIPVLIRTARVGEPANGTAPGTLRISRFGIGVACRDNWLELETIQPEGRREMTARDFVNGQRLPEGRAGRAL